MMTTNQQQLVLDHLWRAEVFADKFLKSRQWMARWREEIVDAAADGIIKAALKYDHNRLFRNRQTGEMQNAKFLTFAWVAVHRRLKQLADRAARGQLGYASWTDLGLHNEDGQELSIEAAVVDYRGDSEPDNEAGITLKKLMAGISERQQQMIRDYYFDGIPQTEMARKYKTTQESIYHNIRHIIGLMRRHGQWNNITWGERLPPGPRKSKQAASV